jgi:hypothetical protein
MKYPSDLTGLDFGGLHVVRRAGKTKQRTSTWECLCGCGNTKVVPRSHLVNGDTKSCGCLQRKTAAKIATSFNAARKSRRKPVARVFLRDGNFDDDLDYLESL